MGGLREGNTVRANQEGSGVALELLVPYASLFTWLDLRRGAPTDNDVAYTAKPASLASD